MSAPQMLFIKEEITLSFASFLRIYWCGSSGNCCFVLVILSALVVAEAVFFLDCFLKNLQDNEASRF